MIVQALMAQGVSDEATLSYDPYWSSVVSLLHLNGTNLTLSPVVEQVSGADQWTISNISGTCYFSTTSSVFGGASLLNTGNNDVCRITSPDAICPQFDGTTAEFTIELRFHCTELSVTRVIAAYAINTGGSGEEGWQLFLNSADSKLYFIQYQDDGSTVAAQVASPSAVSLNQWYAVAVVRQGTNTHLYLDGTKVATTSTLTSLPSPYTVSKQMTLSGSSNGTNFRGYIDEWRYTTVARYTGATYLVRSSAFPDS